MALSNNKIGSNISSTNPLLASYATHGKFLGVYTGRTRDTKDSNQLRGRIAVYIPAFFNASTLADEAPNWFICEWSSPFWGQTFRGIRGEDEKNYRNSQSTYGMWFIPPDPGTEVLVSFKDGNIKNPVIVGCPINNQYNYAVPGYAGGVSYGDPAVNAPVAEKNLNSDPGRHGANVPRPMHADIAEQITQQGLINDPIRGAGRSSARRESPSKVFGILTPGDWDDSKEPGKTENVRKAGHQFVMDDYLPTRMIRLRSGGGNQILLDDTNQGIYCINSKGEVWWEMDATGNFLLYAKRGISLRSQGDFNIRADGSVNIEGGGDVNIKAAGDMRASQYVGGAVQEISSALGGPTLGTGGRVNITGKQSLQFYGDRNVRITAGAGDIDINGGNSVNIQGNGANLLNGAAVNISAPSMPGMVCIHANTKLTLQGIYLDLASPFINAGGGLINLNTAPPKPLTPAIAIPAFKLAGKPLKDQDEKLVPFSRTAAEQGASAFPTQGKRENTLSASIYTICTKLVTAEPYQSHHQSDPLAKASDTDFMQSIVENLPPGSSGDPNNPAPGGVVLTDPNDPTKTVVKKGTGYVDDAGDPVPSATDQIKDAYDEVKGEINDAVGDVKAEVDKVKADFKEQFPEYEEYMDAYNNVSALLDSDLSAIERIGILIGMAQSLLPPIRFPTSNQLEEEIVGLNSKLTELEAKLAEYGIDADQLMANLLTGNVAGLKAQAFGAINEGIAEGLEGNELVDKLAAEGIEVDGLVQFRPDGSLDPMFPSVKFTDKDGNTVVDFSKGMSDPAAALLEAGKLNTIQNEISAEIGQVTSRLGQNQNSGLTSFANQIGGTEKFMNSNVGQQLKRADAYFAQSGTAGSRTPEEQVAYNTAVGIMANTPRLMKGWVLASDRPGGPMVYQQSLADQRQIEIELFTSTDDMDLMRIYEDATPGGETTGSMLLRILAAKEEYFANRTPAGKDTEFGKIVTATST